MSDPLFTPCVTVTAHQYARLYAGERVEFLTLYKEVGEKFFVETLTNQKMEVQVVGKERVIDDGAIRYHTHVCRVA
jgi:hypothetical protein